MKNIILIHGFNGIPLIFNYFKKEFEAKGYNVVIPQFPLRTDITVEGYENVLKNYKAEFNDDVTVIAHSIGNPMIIKYITKYNIKINQYISLAGFGEAYNIDGRDDINMVTKLIPLTEYEIATAKKLINERISIYSNNDHIVPRECLENYYKMLDSKPILIENIGHMGKKSGVSEIPQVIDLIS